MKSSNKPNVAVGILLLLAAAFFSIALILRGLDFGILGVSVGGGIFHNMGQLLVAFVLLEKINVFYYMPFLIISGVVSALITGTVAKMVIKRTDVLF